MCFIHCFLFYSEPSIIISNLIQCDISGKNTWETSHDSSPHSVSLIILKNTYWDFFQVWMSCRWGNMGTVYQLWAEAPHHLLSFNSSLHWVLWICACSYWCLPWIRLNPNMFLSAFMVHPMADRKTSNPQGSFCPLDKQTHETGPKIGLKQSDQTDRHGLVPEEGRGGALFTCAIKLNMLTSVTGWQWLRFSGSLQLNPDSGLWTGTLLSCIAWRAGSQGSGKRNVII